MEDRRDEAQEKTPRKRPRRKIVRNPRDKQNVHTLIADGVLVDSADPFGDGVATGDGVRYAGRGERAGRPAQPLFDLFRCHERPFPADWFNRCLRHGKRSL
jgi:hypothetical protein